MSNPKPVEEVVACVVDYGTFLPIAERLAETMATVYYHTPFQTEYQDIRNCIKGCGLERVRRLDEFLDPHVFNSIDLFVFPDIGFGGLQRHLRSLGKAVWGHMGADSLELFRSRFLEVLDEVGLPKAPARVVVGLSALADYLKENDNKWIKIDRFRGNMETWHHRNYKQSLRTLEGLAVIFGGAREDIVFVVVDAIESDDDEIPVREVGYDGWNVDGQFPVRSFQGLEDKNELYLGSCLEYDDLPEEIKVVNEAMAPVLRDFGYRCWWATEIRVKDGIPYFIDPTARMPGQTGEHQLETCTNFADVVWQGANGVLIEPDFKWKFAAEATLHYTQNQKDPNVHNEWKVLEIPEDIKRWVKLYGYCQNEGVCHFPLEDTDEVGVVLGVGDEVELSLQHLQENIEALKELPVECHVGGFAKLLDSIKHAESEGIAFGGRIPQPESILKKMEL